MDTLRERHNQILKGEIDRFASRMKEAIDNFEFLVKAHERMNWDLTAEIDRLEAPGDQANQIPT